MKKGIFLILLASIAAGCANSTISNIPAQYKINAKTQSSLVLGKITFVGIEPGFGQLLFVLQDAATEQDHPIKIAPARTRQDERTTDYYYFIELPAGHYSIREITAVHQTFEIVDAYLLHANVTIPKSSIVYIGTIKVKNLKHSLNRLAPITENEIVDERQDVSGVFKERYPQFKEARVETKLIDEYELFKEDGIGGKF
ncbi:MAG: hypothetical protein A2787_00540 [Omnitrophica WOR_2 bacterium RIFCSPHIGHO2_01_FULL_48_9]|nr:MAG: hypothetical protein A3D10_00050 [Omnitrophica WOR_2 bacterium RIFCSPHIGHO2_02_FULL_48_11]OGX33620.1 MAG: hypothetical protein A2787_00540 [Omnitrophica WOR_2 bacterium RIFCSPHIGHO2_01_FULL_48_9]